MAPTKAKTNPRIGVPRTLLGLAFALEELDGLLKKSPEDADLRAAESAVLTAKGFWARLDRLEGEGIAAAAENAREEIASVLDDLAREWRSKGRTLDLREFINQHAREFRFEDRLHAAAHALGLIAASSLNPAKPKYRRSFPSFWALSRLTEALAQESVERRLTGPEEGGAGPRSAADEVVASVLGRTRGGTLRHRRKHQRR